MKAQAIIYTSNAGHTADYAKLLSERLGLPAYTLDEAKTTVKKGASVIYLGWLMAGIVKGYKKANRRYDVTVVAGVGMTPPSDSERARLSRQNNIASDKFYMLLGGYDIKKLTGVYKFMMACMSKAISAGMSKKQTLTDDEKLMLDMAVNGRYCVSDENLSPLIAAIQK